MAVPFHTPTVPFWTCISEVKAKDQRRDSYQPRERGDHSKYWMRMGEGSMPVILADWIMLRIEGEGVSVEDLCGDGRRGVSWSRSVRTVWRGSSVSQDSIHCVVGSKAPFVEKPAVA
jgi:hypothetical protein